MKITNHIFKHFFLFFLLNMIVISCSHKNEQKEEKGFKPEFIIGNYGISNTDKRIAMYTTFPCGKLGSCAGYRDTLNVKFDSTSICIVGKQIYLDDSFNDSLYKFTGNEDWKNIPELTILDDSIVAIKMNDSTPTNYSTDGELIYYFEQQIDTNKTKVFITVNEELLITKNRIYSKGVLTDRKMVSFPIYFFEERLPE